MKAGTIINISSISGVIAGYSPHAYTAAKFAVIGLTKSVALELGERGIRVNAICPDGVATAIFAPVARELLSAELIESAPDIVEPWLAEGVPLGRSGLHSLIHCLQARARR
jgi:NAD(P)-dependent dehydrogenase (short-subunit alcohol dehydrogenase family)